MFKIIIGVFLLAVSVYCTAPPAPPTADESKADLMAAGISETAASGIVAIGEKYKDQFQSLKSDIDTYIKTQPEADQTAYKTYVEKKKADMASHLPAQ